jgi:hypothetical protein
LPFLFATSVTNEVCHPYNSDWQNIGSFLQEFLFVPFGRGGCDIYNNDFHTIDGFLQVLLFVTSVADEIIPHKIVTDRLLVIFSKHSCLPLSIMAGCDSYNN